MKNYRNRLRLVLAVLLLASGNAAAADGFDCEFRLTAGQAPVRELALSEAVYACMRHSNYRDLEIVNGDGNRVPFEIEHPSARRELVDFRKPLRFNLDAIEPGGRYHQQLRRLVRLTRYGNNGPGYQDWNREHAYLASIVVENPETDADLNRIRIGLGDLDGGSVSASVYLEYSNDLSRWTSSSQAQKLFFLNTGHEGFQRQQLILGANRRWRYLRIVVLSNSSRFVDSIAELEGIYQRSRFVNPEFVWVEANSIQQLGNGQDWQFSVPAQLPVSRLRFQPANDIVYYSGRLMSKPIEKEVPEDNAYLSLRDDRKKKLKQAVKHLVRGSRRDFESINSGWGSVTRFQQFHFESANGNAVEAEPVFFPHQPSRHWRIVFDHPSSAMIDSHFPVVEFGWTAARVRFLAQGPEPFLLRAGMEAIPQRPASPAFLRSGTQDAERVSLLQTGARLKPPAASDASAGQPDGGDGIWASNGQLVIWMVLIAGVLVMAFMAWQLLRSIEARANQEND